MLKDVLPADEAEFPAGLDPGAAPADAVSVVFAVGVGAGSAAAAVGVPGEGAVSHRSHDQCSHDRGS